MKEKIDVLEHATEILQALQSGVLLVTKDAPVQFRICFLSGGEVAAQLLHRLHHLLLGSHAVSTGLIY